MLVNLHDLLVGLDSWRINLAGGILAKKKRAKKLLFGRSKHIVNGQFH
jgi:hypothetical protein